MIDLLASMQITLREAGFSLSLGEFERSTILHFEDESLMGFGCVFGDPADLLERWYRMEHSLLLRYAQRLRTAGEKAWNVYMVLLCGSTATDQQFRRLSWIEEDLERTRKIAACGIGTREDLILALLPLLPIQHLPVLRPEDVTERVKRRIATIAPKAANVALDRSVPASDVVRLIGETE